MLRNGTVEQWRLDYIRASELLDWNWPFGTWEFLVYTDSEKQHAFKLQPPSLFGRVRGSSVGRGTLVKTMLRLWRFKGFCRFSRRSPQKLESPALANVRVVFNNVPQ